MIGPSHLIFFKQKEKEIIFRTVPNIRQILRVTLADLVRRFSFFFPQSNIFYPINERYRLQHMPYYCYLAQEEMFSESNKPRTNFTVS